MSSKLVKGGATDAQEISWRAVGRGQPTDVSVPFPPPSGEISTDTEVLRRQIQELETQVAGLSRDSERQAQATFQKGLQQGEANARQQLSAQVDAALERLARTVEEISGTRQRCRREAEQDVVTLALAIARRIVRRELTVDPEAILGMIKAAFQKIDAREVHRIRVHSDHAGILRQHLERIGLPQRCDVIGDATLERGAALLEMEHGTLDASADTQLAEIERGFTDLVRHTT